ncbi:head-tail joining protein [Wolbachia endosymbiont of Pentidionis agamae]|uniref:head-tail joining protein n=1 Tax=Wolbachia endosymbiont of Pentidionis agamae TaxID=3110435 RepID=UPI002FD0CC1D
MFKHVQRLFADCFLYLGHEALYKSNGKTYLVQILKQQPDKFYEIGDGQFVGKMLNLKVSVFDILQPMIGDIFVIGDCRYKIHSPPLRDNSGMV